MDFIERFFGISPDGGDGTTELLCVSILFLFACAGLSTRKILKLFARGRQETKELQM